MSERSWAKLREVVERVLDRPAGEHAAALTALCEGDPELRKAAEDLIAHEPGTKGFLEPPIQGAVAAVLGEAVAERGVGQRFGPYRATGVIARGGMGTVYRAVRVDDAFERVVAVKVVSHPAALEHSAQRFEEERRVLARLSHPNIAALLDGGWTIDGSPFLVLEYVAGTPITEHCHESKLSLRQRVEVVLKVARAVAHAHQNLVVHRDIKPANILVTSTGDPKLVDFGTSKLLEESGTDPTVTHLRALTPRYASPEQLLGLSVTTASDVYSLGVVLYELLTGTLPREPRPGRQSAAAMFERDDPVMPIALNPGLDRELNSVCLKAIAIDAPDRYGSMEAFAADLARWLAGEPVSAQRGSVIRTARSWARRRPALMIAASAGVLLTVGVAVTASVAAVRLAVERRRTLDAERVALRTNQFLVGTIESADERAFAGAELSARALLDDAVRRVNVSAEGDPALAASLHLSLGKAYHSLNRSGDAAEQFRAALENALTAHGVRHSVTADARMHLAAVLVDLGQTDEGSRHARDAVELNKKLERHAETADSLCVLARIAVTQKDTARAMGLLTQAERIRRRFPTGGETTLPMVLEAIADCRIAIGESDSAIAGMHEAARIRTELDGPSSSSAAYGLYRIGTAYFLLGKHAEAEDSMRRSLELARALHGDQNVTLTRQMVGLAKVLLAEGRRAEAGVLLEESARLARTSLPPWHYVNIYCRANWAEFLIDQGDHDRAEEELVAAYLGMTDPGNGSCHDPGFVTAQLVRLFEKEGRVEDAARWRARGAAHP